MIPAVQAAPAAPNRSKGLNLAGLRPASSLLSLEVEVLNGNRFVTMNPTLMC